jgi:hypothetical protein
VSFGRTTRVALAATCLALAVPAPATLAESARDIVAGADRVRNPQQPFRATIATVEYRDGVARDKVVLTNHVKLDSTTGQFRNLVRYVVPARDEGKLVLLTGSSMWFYDPATKSSIRISPQQRLMGQASNGDVLTANLARDYAPTLVGEVMVRDAEGVERRASHLELAAATPEAMYARIYVWIETGTYRAIKARYHSSSGRLLKIAYFGKYEQVLGGVRPTETIIIDAVNANRVTKISYSEIRAADIRDAWFQRDYLPRFTGK